MHLSCCHFGMAVTPSVQCLTQVHVQVNTIEEVDEQRQFIEAMPRRVRELMHEVDTSKVGGKRCEAAALSLPRLPSAGGPSQTKSAVERAAVPLMHGLFPQMLRPQAKV